MQAYESTTFQLVIVQKGLDSLINEYLFPLPQEMIVKLVNELKKWVIS